MNRLIYGEVGGQPLSMLFERPEGWAAGDLRPALVWIHGGGWRGGNAEQFTRHMAYAAALGAVSYSIEYRLACDTVAIPDCLADCRAAIAYLRGHAGELGIDPARIYAAGDSAGGHLACCLGNSVITPDANERVQLVINCNGVVDLTMKFMRHLFDEEKIGVPANVDEWMARYAAAEALSPLYQVTPDHAPMLHVQGLLDPVVTPQETLRYHRALEQAGVPSTLWLLPDISHAFILYDYKIENERVQDILEEIGQWLTSQGWL